MQTSFHTDNKATEKESTRFIFTFVIKLVEHSQQLDLWINTEVLPQSVVLFHLSPLCG